MSTNDTQNIVVEQARILPRPTPKPVNFDAIPQTLKNRKQWCLWKYEKGKPDRDGLRRWTKVPHKPALGCKASSSDPSTWSTYEQVRDFYLKHNKPDVMMYGGVGYFLTKDDDVIGIDGDHQFVDGRLKDEARTAIKSINSYTEVSPSNEGIRIFARGKLPPTGRKKGDWEMYEDVRFLTITGNQVEGTPDDVYERQEEITRLHAEKIGEHETKKPKSKSSTSTDANHQSVPTSHDDTEIIEALKADPLFADLWEGEWVTYNSQSEADFALVNRIAYYAGPDSETIDRIFRLSGLYRPKWDRIGPATIAKALGDKEEFYDWSEKAHQETQCEWGAYTAYHEGQAQDPFADEDRYTKKASETKSDQPYGQKYEFKPLSSAEFDKAEYKLEWLVTGVLVKGQPTIVGGPKKSLKTSTLIELAISLGTGTKFFGKFETRKTRVAVISGESGEHTIQETARRICKAKGVNLADADVFWDFRLPKLSVEEEIIELSAGLARMGIEVVIIDPLYLCLLAGSDKQASNLYDMGPLLSDVSQACIKAGAMPILTHHTKKSSNGIKTSIELDDLSFGGVQEFARQWLLVNRRNAYTPGSGFHELWLTSGGSVGHGGLWGIDIDEGQLQEDFSGRTWKTEVLNTEEIRAKENQRKEYESLERAQQAAERKLQEDEESSTTLINTLARMLTEGSGTTKTALKKELRWNDAKFKRVLDVLLTDETVKEVVGTYSLGSGASKKGTVLVLAQ